MRIKSIPYEISVLKIILESQIALQDVNGLGILQSFDVQHQAWKQGKVKDMSTDERKLKVPWLR